MSPRVDPGNACHESRSGGLRGTYEDEDKEAETDPSEPARVPGVLDRDLHLLDALFHIVRDNRRSLFHLGDDDVLSFDHDGHLASRRVVFAYQRIWTSRKERQAGTHILKELCKLDERLLDPRELGGASLYLAQCAPGRLTAIARSLQTRIGSILVFADL